LSKSAARRRRPSTRSSADPGGADGRRQRVGEQVGPRALAQQVDDGLRPGDVAADGPAQRLAERAGEDMDLVRHAEMVRRAAALRPHEAGGVAIVDHDDGVVAFRQRRDLRQGREIAVHGEDAVGGDHDRPRAIGAGGLS
jgi:hypothetical protein